jgi:hypothetical protein
MQIRSLRFLAPALALAATLGACADSGVGAGRGTLRVALTDAPFPYTEVQSANIHVVRIDAKRDESSESEADGASKNDDSQPGAEDRHGEGWVTVATPNRVINIFELQNGKVMNLGEQSLPTGTYKGFRLVIDASKSGVVLKSGQAVDIKWPSAARSGIKVKLEKPITITEGETLMVIDFDLAGSFVMRGNSISQNGLLFKPVIRGVARDVAGSIAGTVRANTADGAVVNGASVQVWKVLADTATAGSVPLATAGSDAAGAYKVAALLPGSYALRVLPPAGSTNKQALVESVTVTTGQTTTTNVVLLP